MISLEFSPANASSTPLSPASVRQQQAAKGSHSFSDSHYLRQIIRVLRNERKRRGLDVRQLAARAKLKEGVITKAENNGMVPSSREFRNWAKSLGLQWEQLWTLAFPLAETN